MSAFAILSELVIVGKFVILSEFMTVSDCEFMRVEWAQMKLKTTCV